MQFHATNHYSFVLIRQYPYYYSGLAPTRPKKQIRYLPYSTSSNDPSLLKFVSNKKLPSSLAPGLVASPYLTPGGASGGTPGGTLVGATGGTPGGASGGTLGGASGGTSTVGDSLGGASSGTVGGTVGGESCGASEGASGGTPGGTLVGARGSTPGGASSGSSGSTAGDAHVNA
jgi:hypothetical protein